MYLKNIRVLLTGATGGIGQAIAQALDNQGSRLLLVSRSAERLEALCSSLQGNQHEFIATDLTVADDRNRLVERCESIDGGIDLLINNAGIGEFQFLEKQTQSRIEEVITINLVSPILLCQSLVPHLKSRPAAQIVNIGSTYGSIGYPGFTTYCASKFGLRGFSEALRRELADTSIGVSYIAPRSTRTGFNATNVVAMNEALGNTMDSPTVVARRVVDVIQKSDQVEHYMGWPEKFFVRVNALLPNMVDNNLKKQLSKIRHFASSQ